MIKFGVIRFKNVDAGKIDKTYGRIRIACGKTTCAKIIKDKNKYNIIIKERI